jgi:hypothetical protein
VPSTRVLRLPGFVNHKYARPHLVRAGSLARETYRPEHFPELSTEEKTDRLRTDPPSSNAAPITTRSNTPVGTRCACAKRALGRGESPALVAAAIAS